MKEPHFEKCAQEATEMQDLPPASVEVSRLGVFAIITLIQAAVQQQPEIADDGWVKIGIAAARQLQEDLFKDSETYEVLEFGWNPEAYITPSVIAAMLSRRSDEDSDDADLMEEVTSLLAKLQNPESAEPVPSDQV
jgi:hypothetical protein